MQLSQLATCDYVFKLKVTYSVESTNGTLSLSWGTYLGNCPVDLNKYVTFDLKIAVLIIDFVTLQQLGILDGETGIWILNCEIRRFVLFHLNKLYILQINFQVLFLSVGFYRLLISIWTLDSSIAKFLVDSLLLDHFALQNSEVCESFDDHFI